jgi:hypothetical protein
LKEGVKEGQKLSVNFLIQIKIEVHCNVIGGETKVVSFIFRR